MWGSDCESDFLEYLYMCTHINDTFVTYFSQGIILIVEYDILGTETICVF